MSNFSSQTKEYLRIASRFLKEVGLYDLWIRYCYDPKKSKSWVDKDSLLHKELKITDILGCTTFTDYVREHRPKAIKKFSYCYCMYEVFGEYVKKMHPEYANKIECSSTNVVSIDEEKKKIRI